MELEKSPLVILDPSYLPYAEDNHCSDIKIYLEEKWLVQGHNVIS